MNFMVATAEVFSEYGVTITTERQLSNGMYMRHFELIGDMIVTCHLDERVVLYTEEAMREYINFVEGGNDE